MPEACTIAVVSDLHYRPSRGLIAGRADGIVANRLLAVCLDAGDARLIPCVDPEAPGDNARRKTEMFEQVRQAASGSRRPTVVLQHVPVLPPGRSDCPYGYTNVEEILALNRELSITLTLSGHYHRGVPMLRQGSCLYWVSPAFCEGAHPFRVIHLSDDAGEVHSYALGNVP